MANTSDKHLFFRKYMYVFWRNLENWRAFGKMEQNWIYFKISVYILWKTSHFLTQNSTANKNTSKWKLCFMIKETQSLKRLKLKWKPYLWTKQITLCRTKSPIKDLYKQIFSAYAVNCRQRSFVFTLLPMTVIVGYCVTGRGLFHNVTRRCELPGSKIH